MTVLEPDTVAVPRKDLRREELAKFLRACRARVRPEDVGLPPGLRRRTPGLRREEVAQLAGLGVTWYTWLEQGRPINASEQVLASVARTLRLDAAERDHLFRLAGVRPPSPAEPDDPEFDGATQAILDQLGPLPAAVCNTRFDVLRHNAAYEALFPRATRPARPGGPRNNMWCAFTVPDCCNPFLNRDEELPRMVGVLRAAYGRHLGEPVWEAYVRDLSAASDRFRELWDRQEVAPPRTTRKVFRHAGVGVLNVRASYLTLPDRPEVYLVVYTPEGPEDRRRLERMAAEPAGARPECTHGTPGPERTRGAA
ncbi:MULTISPECIES: helix-turn-helix transcriptional regulator [Kitasatospora]|uniref:Helix-turn-helix transcriptional regulator n=1 Tax=Kitasatospora arboriphila TaxID=258052 RepID=A0ABN1TRC8_9ACTN